VQREHRHEDNDAGELSLKLCDDEKELQQDSDSHCMHSAMQKGDTTSSPHVMVEPIRDEDIHEDLNCMHRVVQEGLSNPRTHMMVGPSGNVCDGFWDKKVAPMDKCKEDVPPDFQNVCTWAAPSPLTGVLSTIDGVTDTTHRLWEDAFENADLMETADDGCMWSPRPGSFGGMQFQGETPGQNKCCWMQRCYDFCWIQW